MINIVSNPTHLDPSHLAIEAEDISNMYLFENTSLPAVRYDHSN